VVEDQRWGERHEWDVSFFTDIAKIPPGANNATLDQLSAEFFEFYATRFEWEKKAIAIRLGLTEHDSETGVDRSQIHKYVLAQKSPDGSAEWYGYSCFD